MTRGQVNNGSNASRADSGMYENDRYYDHRFDDRCHQNRSASRYDAPRNDMTVQELYSKQDIDAIFRKLCQLMYRLQDTPDHARPIHSDSCWNAEVQGWRTQDREDGISP